MTAPGFGLALMLVDRPIEGGVHNGLPCRVSDVHLSVTYRITVVAHYGGSGPVTRDSR
jgi:hypothetical protein